MEPPLAQGWGGAIAVPPRTRLGVYSWVGGTRGPTPQPHTLGVPAPTGRGGARQLGEAPGLFGGSALQVGGAWLDMGGSWESLASLGYYR